MYLNNDELNVLAYLSIWWSFVYFSKKVNIWPNNFEK